MMAALALLSSVLQLFCIHYLLFSQQSFSVLVVLVPSLQVRKLSVTGFTLLTVGKGWSQDLNQIQLILKPKPCLLHCARCFGK